MELADINIKENTKVTNSVGRERFTFSDGSTVTGEWRDSKLNGYAIRYDAAGNIIQKGIYKDNEWLHDKVN